MAWLHDVIHWANELSGLWLLLILLVVASTASEVSRMSAEIACLHKDMDRRNHFHDEAAMQSEV